MCIIQKRKDDVITMAGMTRSEAREEVFLLLFETEFHNEQTPEEIFALAAEIRGFEAKCKEQQRQYIRHAYFGVREKCDEIDERISHHASGWRADRIAPVPRNILRLCVFEMLYVEDVPLTVAINEAIELTKKFGEEKAKSFVNGVLNGIKAEIEADKH